MNQISEHEKTPPMGVKAKKRAAGVSWQSRDELPFLLNKLGLFGVGVEVGCERFNFGRHIRNNWDGKLQVEVDAWTVNDNYKQSRERHLQSHDEAIAKIAASTRPVELIKKWSVEAAREIAESTNDRAIKRLWDGGLDWVYLDADHSHAAVLSDIEAWYPLLKSGGLFCGHDYVLDGWCRAGDPSKSYATIEEAGTDDACLFGVRSALAEAFPDQELAITAPDDCQGWQSWAFIKP